MVEIKLPSTYFAEVSTMWDYIDAISLWITTAID